MFSGLCEFHYPVRNYSAIKVEVHLPHLSGVIYSYHGGGQCLWGLNPAVYSSVMIKMPETMINMRVP